MAIYLLSSLSHRRVCFCYDLNKFFSQPVIFTHPTRQQNGSWKTLPGEEETQTNIVTEEHMNTEVRSKNFHRYYWTTLQHCTYGYWIYTHVYICRSYTDPSADHCCSLEVGTCDLVFYSSLNHLTFNFKISGNFKVSNPEKEIIFEKLPLNDWWKEGLVKTAPFQITEEGNVPVSFFLMCR